MNFGGGGKRLNSFIHGTMLANIERRWTTINHSLVLARSGGSSTTWFQLSKCFIGSFHEKNDVL